MAEAAIVEALESNLSSPIRNELVLIWGVEEQLQKLSDTLLVIRAATLSVIRPLLEDGRRRPGTETQRVKNWVEKVKSAVYEVNDLVDAIDECAIEALQSDAGAGQVHKPLVSLSNLKNAMLSYKMGRKIMAIEEKLRVIGEERTGFELREVIVKVGLESSERVLTLFVAGGRKGRGLADLGALDLMGRLLIEHLWNVNNPLEAKEADLMSKSRLRSLGLSWLKHNEGFPQMDLNVEEVVDALRPHSNLQELQLEWYVGRRFPTWLQALFLPNLVKISLHGCSRCLELPPLGQLPFLGFLSICEMDSLKHVGNEIHGAGTEESFPSLKILELEKMPNLITWLWRLDYRVVFPSLVELIISNCPKLVSLPYLPSVSRLSLDNNEKLMSFPWWGLRNFASLQSLRICSYNKLKPLYEAVENLANLISLKIESCEELDSLSTGFGNLEFLQKLVISDCHKLLTLPEAERFTSFISLKDLKIVGCHRLTSLSDGLQFLSALESLEISDCPRLTRLPEGMQHLPSLEILSVVDCGQLASLPNGLQFVSTLQFLEIDGDSNQMILPEWIGNLTSLRVLEITCCDNQTSLPANLCCLTALEKLVLRGCLELVRRCQKDNGEDWYKIAHIPNVRVSTRKNIKVWASNPRSTLNQSIFSKQHGPSNASENWFNCEQNETMRHARAAYQGGYSSSNISYVSDPSSSFHVENEIEARTMYQGCYTPSNSSEAPDCPSYRRQ